jgi:hypothetical protein
MMVFGLVAPDNYVSTIYFAQRWIPCSVILLLLALPLPSVKTPHLLWPVILLCIYFSDATTRIWIKFNQEELSGLHEALDALPKQQRVLGLDFVQGSSYLKGMPFVQTFAYAQVYKGGELSFSFAQHMTGIVVARAEREIPWSRNLEFYPKHVKFSDFAHFDYIFMNADLEAHMRWSTCPYLEPVTKSGRWRLYRIKHDVLDEVELGSSEGAG